MEAQRQINRYLKALECSIWWVNSIEIYVGFLCGLVVPLGGQDNFSFSLKNSGHSHKSFLQKPLEETLALVSMAAARTTAYPAWEWWLVHGFVQILYFRLQTALSHLIDDFRTSVLHYKCNDSQRLCVCVQEPVACRPLQNYDCLEIERERWSAINNATRTCEATRTNIKQIHAPATIPAVAARSQRHSSL